MITRPMKALGKALTDEQLDNLNYPVIASAKLDGIRALIINNEVLSSSFKPIRNRYIQSKLSKPEYNYLDGELVVGRPDSPDAFSNTTGVVRGYKGRPDFMFYVFDNFEKPDSPYSERWLNIDYPDLPFVKVLPQFVIHSKEVLLEYENQCLNAGFEGIMIRDPNGIYKQGRTTFNEGIIFKRKPRMDGEAVIVGFVEEHTNQNKLQVSELGTSFRSSSKANKVPTGTLGALILKSDLFDDTFHVNARVGKINDMRQEIWDNQELYLGKMVTFMYQGHGTKGRPRLPVLKGFRSEDDITSF